MDEYNEIKVETSKLTVERRWTAARRLAAGDDLHLAAARAGLHEDQVAQMLEKDPGFPQLVEAARSVLALSEEERRAVACELASEALEDQLGARNATVLNQALRLTGQFDGKALGDGYPDLPPHALIMASFSMEELTEYLWIGVRDHMPEDERDDLPYEPPPEFEERVRVLDHKLRELTIERQASANDDRPDDDDVNGPPKEDPG